MTSRNKLAIDLNLLSPDERTQYDAMTEQEKNEYLGFGSDGTRAD